MINLRSNYKRVENLGGGDCLRLGYIKVRADDVK